MSYTPNLLGLRRLRWRGSSIRERHYWHNGATGGYSAYVFFNPKGDYAAVVLLNTSISEKGSYADQLGEHISERLAGKPAISLEIS